MAQVYHPTGDYKLKQENGVQDHLGALRPTQAAEKNTQKCKLYETS